MKGAALACMVVAALAAQTGTAAAAWAPSGNGSGAAQAKQMPSGNQPTASVSNRDVAVSWAASSFSGGGNVSGYTVKRYDTNGNSQSIGSACSGTLSGLTCTENRVPAGTWKYSVTPKQGNNWTGTESSQSASVTVQSPSFSFTSSTTLTGLPATLNGNISNYIQGQTVTFRLDDPNTGTVLSGSISPSPVPASGNATTTTTIPSGTSNGSHTVYAVGSQGDVASAAITVNVAVARSVTAPAWTVSDLSSGTASDASDPYAAVGGPNDFELGFQPAFDTNRYLAFNFNGPLRAGFSTSGVNFNFDYVGTNAAITAGANTCFYFEVRRISTGNVVATHGSPASPVDCVNQFTFKATSTALPEVTDTGIANDLQIRVYMDNADGAGFNFEDLATVSGNEGSNAFTLYDTQRVNQASGTPTTTPWKLNASGDGAVLTSGSGWDNSFNTSKYLKLSFPAYVPSAATGISATFKHSYKSDTSGKTTCWYFEVYNGATLLATHGSSSTPVSCNAGSGFTTDSVLLPEVDSVAKANNLVIRIYAKNDATTGGANARKSDHDLATVKIDYTG
jgi:hypothetical protein